MPPFDGAPQKEQYDNKSYCVLPGTAEGQVDTWGLLMRNPKTKVPLPLPLKDVRPCY